MNKNVIIVLGGAVAIALLVAFAKSSTDSLKGSVCPKSSIVIREASVPCSASRFILTPL